VAQRHDFGGNRLTAIRDPRVHWLAALVETPRPDSAAAEEIVAAMGNLDAIGDDVNKRVLRHLTRVPRLREW